MPLGNTAKKLQKVATMAEDVYGRLAELGEQLQETQETVEATSRRLDRLEAEAAEQRALLEAVAADRGIDLDTVTARAHIGEAEAEGEAGTDATAEATTAGAPGGTAEADDGSDAGTTDAG